MDLLSSVLNSEVKALTQQDKKGYQKSIFPLIVKNKKILPSGIRWRKGKASFLMGNTNI